MTADRLAEQPGMGTWNGERLGRLSLRLDSAYCAILGAGVVAAAPVIADVLSVSVWAPVVAGTLVVVWAGLIRAMLKVLSMRAALRVVLCANVVAASAIALVSGIGNSIFISLVVLAIAVDVGLFAGSQAVALRRLRTPG